MRVLGIDEAGRGCVLGDLVIAGYCPHDPDEAALWAAGAADSKTLTAERRIEARTALAGLGRVEVRRVDARAIDGGNLNRLEEDAIVDIIVALRPDVIRLDALGHPATLPALQRRLQARLPEDLQPEWTIEPKADATFACVGAASIFAKTLRDELLDAIRASFGDLGSGYPNDPRTKAWLRGWSSSGAPWPAFVRTRWQTIENLGQQALF
jgi:ribonuclease HII